MMADLSRALAVLLNRGALPPAMIVQLVGQAMAAKIPVSRCPQCRGARLHDNAKGTARCLACGKSFPRPDPAG
ncbi:hypothetical protein [Luteitalea sp.]